MLKLLRNSFLKYLKDERGFLLTAAALAAAGGVGGALLKRGKKAKSSLSDRPPMASYESFRSKYDQPSAKDVHGFYSKRVKGDDLGFSPEDMSTMRAEAIDQAGSSSKELSRIAGAGHRTRTGGMETGGTGRIQRASVGQFLLSRSKAMRDVAIKNAVIKRQEQSAAAEGLQGFLSGERQQQGARFRGELSKKNYDLGIAREIDEENQKVSDLNRQRKTNFYDDLIGAGMAGISAGTGGAGGAGKIPWKSILSRQR